MHFIYRSAAGQVAAWRIERPQVSGDYIQGFAGGHFRTFRRDRILRELLPADDVEALLAAFVNQNPLPFDAPPARPRRGEAIEVLFTGYAKADRADLEAWAGAQGLCVVKSLTRDLGVLCVNGHVGPGALARSANVDKAREGGALVLDENQLMKLVATGEIPEQRI